MAHRPAIEHSLPVAFTACVAVVLAACSSGVSESNGATKAVACELPVVVGQLPSDLGEASGIVRDPRRADLYWLHNDSGNDPVLFAVDTTGALVGRTPIVGATSRDVEDVAVARCGADWCLYYADMGDNAAVHPDIVVHRLPLPPIPSDAAVLTDPVSPLASYTLVYPGGPRDAESLFVDSGRGELGIVSKGRNDIVELYVADLQALESADGPVALRRVGRLDVPIDPNVSSYLVTAADLSPDGARLAVRSYAALYLFDWAGSAGFDTLAVSGQASLVPAIEPQGEGVAFAADGKRLYLASEGRDNRPPQLTRIDCRP